MKRLFALLLSILRLRSADPKPQFVVTSLSDFPAPEVEPLDVLLDKLENGTPQERCNAAHGLRRHQDPNVVPRLIALLSDSDLYVRVQAIQSLRSSKVDRAVLPLCDLLERTNPAESLISSNVIRALAAIGDKRAVPTLIKALESVDPFTRSDAADALGEIGDPSAIPSLQKLENDDALPKRYHDDGGVSGAPAVNFSAAKAIEKIRGKAEKSVTILSAAEQWDKPESQ